MKRLTVVALTLVACGDTNDPPPPTFDPSQPIYAVSSTLFGPDGNTTYVALTQSLASGELDYTQAIEVAGDAFTYPIEGDAPLDTVFLGLGEDVSIQRVEIAADGALVPGAKMSLAGAGVTTHTFEGVVFVDDDTAWYVDVWSQLQVLIWNPQTMTIERTFDLPELDRAGYDTTIGRLRPLGGGRYIAPVAWYKYATNEPYPRAAAAIFDVDDERLVAVIEDDRCGALENAIVDAQGDVYLATGLYYPMIRRLLDPNLPAECVLRVRAGAAAFDPSYALDLGAGTGGRPTGFLMPAGDGSAWVQAWNVDRYPSVPDWDAQYDVAAWKWWRIDLASGAAVEDASLPHHGGVAQGFIVGDEFYSSLVAPDYSTATVYEMTGQDTPRAGVAVRGGLYGLARVR